MTGTCPDGELEMLMTALASGAQDAFAQLEARVSQYPGDARLHFLRGSLLIGAGRAIEAHAALSEAVALAPDYALARFQLGFFELTSGEPARARRTWEPLDAQLSPEHYLVRFANGLRELIEDRFEGAIMQLEAGIAANDENLPLNGDMQLIIEECRKQLGSSEPEGEASATSLLLDQFATRDTMH
ncbi:tetratricopeptide repeat protein [Sphingomonas koreensis]